MNRSVQLSAALAIILLAGCRPTEPVAATVDGRPITLDLLKLRALETPQAKATLRELILGEAVAAEAHRQGTTITSNEVRASMRAEAARLRPGLYEERGTDASRWERALHHLQLTALSASTAIPRPGVSDVTSFYGDKDLLYLWQPLLWHQVACVVAPGYEAAVLARDHLSRIDATDLRPRHSRLLTERGRIAIGVQWLAFSATAVLDENLSPVKGLSPSGVFVGDGVSSAAFLPPSVLEIIPALSPRSAADPEFVRGLGWVVVAVLNRTERTRLPLDTVKHEVAYEWALRHGSQTRGATLRRIAKKARIEIELEAFKDQGDIRALFPSEPPDEVK